MSPPSLFDLFRGQALAAPDRTAVVFDRTLQLTAHDETEGVLQVEAVKYGVLLSKALELARVLEEKVGRHQPIALHMEPSVEMVTAILGVLAAGCHYIPLNPMSPPAHNANLIEKYEPAALLIGPHQSRSVLPPLLEIDSTNNGCDWSICKSGLCGDLSLFVSAPQPKDSADSAGLAYIMTTSGTTGTPTPVRVPHASIYRNVVEMRNFLHLDQSDVVLMTAPYTFDPSVIDIFAPLSCGATLLVLSNHIRAAPRLCYEALLRHRVSVLHCTPVFLARFGTNSIHQLLTPNGPIKTVALGGEKFPSKSQWQRWVPAASTVRIFNVYGTTEVSCWATATTLDLNPTSCTSSICQENVDDTHIGQPLPSIELMVVDENGEPIEAQNEGEGLLFIGGEGRSCWIGDESVGTETPKWRRTGDVVVKCGTCGCIYYVGRKDGQIKRRGHRMHPATVDRVIMSTPGVPVMASSVIHHVTGDPLTGDLLLAFVVLDGQPQEAHAAIQSHLARSLPSHCHPDDVILLPSLPTNTNGKVDNGALLLLWKSQSKQTVKKFNGDMQLDKLDDDYSHRAIQSEWTTRASLTNEQTAEGTICGNGTHNDESSFGKEETSEFVWSVLIAALQKRKPISGLSIPSPNQSNMRTGRKSEIQDNREIADADSSRHQIANRYLMAEGYTSFDVVAVCQAVFSGLGLVENYDVTLQSLVDIALHQPIGSVMAWGVERIQENRTCCGEVCFLFGGWEQKSAQRPASSNDDQEKPTTLIDTNPSNDSIGSLSRDLEEGKTIKRRRIDEAIIGRQVVNRGECLQVENLQIDGKLELLWKVDTKKCIDASPVYFTIQRNDTIQDLVCVGSHSGDVVCVSAQDGGVLWRTNLSHRVEGTAALVCDGRYLTVGCYDGKIYCLHTQSGAVDWSFQTGDLIKCTPCWHPNMGTLVVCGSHDNHVYGLDPTNQTCRWSVDCKAPIFASPAHDAAGGRLYVATQAGVVWCFEMNSDAPPTHQWSCDIGKPLFSSPVIHNGAVFIGCVDGYFYSISSAGSILWKVQTGGPVFSTACITPSHMTSSHMTSHHGPLLLIGSHDNHVRCITLDGSVLWAERLDSAIYGAPSVLHTDKKGYVVVGTTQGSLYILSLEDGTLAATPETLPGHVFSSPIAASINGTGETTSIVIFVGCRDNYLYAYRIT